MQTNTLPLYHSAAAAHPVFAAQHSGVFVNISSISACRPRPNLVWYAGSKGAVSTITRGLAAEFAEAGARIVGVSKDGIASHAKFADKFAIPYALAADVDGRVCEAFGVWVEKSMYGRKYMGIDRATFLLDEAGRIARSWRKVKVPGHARAVLDAVRAMSTANA